MRGRVSKVVQSAKKQKEIVEQFQDNVSQSTTVNTLNISLSRLHTISKRFRQLGEISVHKGQGRNSILDDCDVWAMYKMQAFWHGHRNTSRNHCLQTQFANPSTTAGKTSVM